MRDKFNSCSGQSLLEFAIMLPLMFLLVVNVVNFGGLLYACITVSNSARAGAAYMTLGPASAQGPVLPSTTLVTAVVNADLSSLPYAGDPATKVTICSNNGGKAQSPESCTPPVNPATGAMYADPESSTSVLGTVQVKYTYCPFIPFWEFPSLHIHSTLPSCSFSTGGNISGGGTLVSRVAVMRIMQ
jgi:Flp pilus assembly protein TadG